MKKIAIPFLFSFVLCLSSFAQQTDTVRLMTYNLLQYGIGAGQGPGGCSPATVQDKNTYLQIITGYLKPDILAVNELRWSVNNAYASNIKINALTYNPNMAVTAASHTQNDPLSNMLFINTDKFGLLKHLGITGFVRDIDVYRLYYKGNTTAGDTTDLWVIVGHLKAGSASADALERADMAAAIMSWLNQNPSIQNYVLMGDMNIYGSNEQAYKNLLNASNAMRFHDPTGATIGWGGQTYASLHTQSPRTSGTNCGSTGGMDDRFDFILMSDAIRTNSASIGYLANTYKAVGNDGTSYDVALNCTGVVPSSVCAALKELSDHIPVIMDVRMPITVGITSPLSETVEIKLSPNPIQDDLNMELLFHSTEVASYNISIIDLMGKEIYHQAITNHTNNLQTKIDGRNWASGIYFVRLSDEKGNFVSKKIAK